MTIRQTNISLRQLRAFSGVVEAGSFTAASETLCITQSGLSQSVSQLEEILGVPLVLREREGVALTGVGAEVLADAEAALRAIERLRQRCSDYNGLATGTLRVGAVASAAARILPDALKALHDQHPALEVYLIEGTDSEVADWTLDEIVDVGFTAETRRGLQEAVIAEDEYVAVLPKGHPAATHERIALRDLSQYAFVMPGASCEPPIRAMFDDAGATPNAICTVRGTSSLLNMVGAGIGVTIVPELSLPSDLSGLVVVGLEPMKIRRVLAVRNTSVETTPGVKALLANIAVIEGQLRNGLVN